VPRHIRANNSFWITFTSRVCHSSSDTHVSSCHHNALHMHAEYVYIVQHVRAECKAVIYVDMRERHLSPSCAPNESMFDALCCVLALESV
jgi:hypothetical protein